MNAVVRSIVLLYVVMVFQTSRAIAAGSEVQVIPLAKDQVVQKKTTVDLSFDLMRLSKGSQVRLVLDVRVDYPSPCANNPAMKLSVNGRNVVGADLINKSLTYHTKNGREAEWATPGGTMWALFTWPDYSVKSVKEYASPYAVVDQDPFHFVLDITPYARIGKNTVSFLHPEIIPVKHSLVLRNVRIEVGPIQKARRGISATTAPSGPLPTYLPQGSRRVEMKVSLAAGGNIRLEVAARSFDLVSRTSEPAGRWQTTNAKGWRGLARGKTESVVWQGTGYRVSRAVTVCDDHFHVADTFSNTSDKLLGVMHEHSLRLDRKPSDIRLSGRPSYAEYQQDGGGANPTAVAVWKDLAVGLVAEDDIFRTHSKRFARPDAIGLADHELGLEPGKSQTLEWSVYPVPHGDYWDFINAIRRNWDCNFTIPGLHVFVSWSLEPARDAAYYRDWVRSRHAQQVTSSDAMFTDGPAMGTAIPLAKPFCDRTADWIRKLHEGAPEVKALMYMNCTVSTEPDAAKKYADSKLMGWDGVQATIPCAGPKGMILGPCFIATVDNSYGQAMMKTAKWIVENLNTDGLYHDLYTSLGYGARAYNTTWDGCTVSIDAKTHAVTGKASSVALLQRAWHAALAKYLRDQGKMFFGNGQVETRTDLNLHIPIFEETGVSPSVMFDTHLGTPWGYGNLPEADPGRDLYYNTAYNLRRILEYGGILALPNWSAAPIEQSFLTLMYPITPLEIRPGMVLGKERIITSRSGRYGWPGGPAADVYVFDPNGRLIARPQVKVVTEGDQILTEIRMPGDHFAILVPKPKH